MVSFEPTEEQRLVQQTARDVATRTLAPRAAERDRLGTFPEAELRQLASLGLLGVNVPPELGGSGDCFIAPDAAPGCDSIEPYAFM